MPLRNQLFLGGFLGQLGENVGRVSVAAGGEAAQLVQVFFFCGELNELVRGIPAAAVCEAPQLLEILPLGGKFNEFPDGVGVAVGSSFP